MTDTARLPGAAGHAWQWQLRAACREADDDLFYHPPGERGAAHDAREARAKRVCARCPVREPCLAFSLRTREAYGVWGGLTEDERHAVLGPARRTPRAHARH
ncbi:WhiB family transcriptional regulator [Kitasatospora sp. NPDC059571]|uniref:WhiB family transcriptional regulator n=1 Tax=Kitasatospora sp. NPDC059571 TaxID=3346871 RepID=UPI0036A4A8E8